MIAGLKEVIISEVALCLQDREKAIKILREKTLEEREAIWDIFKSLVDEREPQHRRFIPNFRNLIES